jgi:hypothetical protein
MDPVSVSVIAKAGVEVGGLAVEAAREGALASAQTWRGVEEAARFAAEVAVDPVQLGRDVLGALEHLGREDPGPGEDDDLGWLVPIGAKLLPMPETLALAGAAQGAAEQAGPLTLAEANAPASLSGLPETPAEAPPIAQASEGPEGASLPDADAKPEAGAMPEADAGTDACAEGASIARSAAEIPPTVELVNGQYPVNAHLAGQDVPLSEFKGLEGNPAYEGQTIHWTDKGFPDFSPWVHTTPDGTVCDVQIEPTGSRAGDVKAANAACGLAHTPDGWCWHHHEDAGRMQLVPRDLHGAVGHTGGFAIWGHVDAVGAAAEAPAAEPASLWERFLASLGLGGSR